MTEQDAFYNLAERIEDSFSEIDSDICTDLREHDGKYADLWSESIELQEAFPIIPQVTEGDGAISLTAEEHRALVRYLYLKHSMENLERRQIYFHGHTDCFAYLKKIGVL